MSTGNEATRDSRFAFRRHFYQFAAIRYIEGPEVDEMVHMKNVLGMDPAVDGAAVYNYGFGKGAVDAPIKLGIPIFPLNVANISKQIFADNHASGGKGDIRALDMFCSGGRASFELTSMFKEVMGVDYSSRMLQIGFALKERFQCDYSAISTGKQRFPVVAKSENYDWHTRRDQVSFYQADPANLHEHIRGFDLAILWNVLDKSYSPLKTLTHIATRLNPGAIIIVVCPYQWDETITNESEWLCGRNNDDLSDPIDRIAETLGSGWANLPSVTQEVPYYNPQNTRQGTAGEAQLTAWKML